MHTSQEQDNLQAKARLRIEISNQVEDFLHSGGRIEVLNNLPDHNNKKVGHWPAATEVGFTPSISADF
tara:strand:- start:1419 stop:1622 length:204 start_codon:yes stop_codon:yes gene_type:complete